MGLLGKSCLAGLSSLSGTPSEQCLYWYCPMFRPFEASLGSHPDLQGKSLRTPAIREQLSIDFVHRFSKFVIFSSKDITRPAIYSSAIINACTIIVTLIFLRIKVEGRCMFMKNQIFWNLYAVLRGQRTRNWSKLWKIIALLIRLSKLAQTSAVTVSLYLKSFSIHTICIWRVLLQNALSAIFDIFKVRAPWYNTK